MYYTISPQSLRTRHTQVEITGRVPPKLICKVDTLGYYQTSSAFNFVNIIFTKAGNQSMSNANNQKLGTR
jgi:hypothetical protein